MRILNRLGNVPLAKAYTCIKAISKKKEALINQNHEVFIKGSVENGLSEKDAEEIWNLIVKFAGYGFNKSHSTAYALVAYQTAYLKAHYPVEFMAALLSSDISARNFKRKDPLVEHMEDCDRMGIEVVHPDVNTSDADFSVSDGRIHFALSAIKGCGGSTAISIAEERKKNGPFRDIFDFCERVDPANCNKSAIETLIKAGAMDSFGARRSQLTAVIERAVQAGASVQADKKSGQASLFGAFEEEEETSDAPATPLPDIDEWPEREKLLFEKEVLGFYLASHPLAEYENKLASFRTHTTDKLSDVKDRGEVILGGMISAIKFAHTKNGKPGSPTKYANFDLEDMQGSVRCIVWPKGFVDCGERVQPDAVVLAKGKCDRRGGGDEVNLIIDELIPLDELDKRYTHGMRIRLDEQEHDQDTMGRLREIVRGYPGSQELLFSMSLAEGETVHLKSDKYRVDVTPELRDRIDDLLGVGPLQTADEQTVGAVSRLQVFPFFDQSGHRDAVGPVRLGFQWRFGIERQLVDLRRELVAVVQELLERPLLARVSRHPAHRRDRTGHHTPFEFVVRRVLTNRLDQVIPFDLVRVVLSWFLATGPNQFFFVPVVTGVRRGTRRPVRR